MGELIGMLISRFPFHRQIAAAFVGGGYHIDLIPVTGLTFIDELNVLLIAVVISGGISTTLKNIFYPEGGGGLKAIRVSVLSSIVTIFTASYLFSGLAMWMGGNFVGRLLWPVLKVLVLAALLGIFYLFVKGVAGLSKGEIRIGLLGFFALKAVLQTLAADVLCVCLLLMLL